LYQLAKGAKEFLAVAFAGNDRILSADQKHRIKVWEARTGKLLRQFAHDAPIRFLLASPDGRWLASLEQRPSPFGRQVDPDEVVHIWDLTTGTRKQSLHSKVNYWFSNVLFSPNGKSLLTASRRPGGRDEVVLWDRETGRRLREFNGTSGISGDVATISPDGRRLVEGSWTGKFELWDLENGRRLTSEDSRHTRFAAVRLSATGDRATTIGLDSISSWDATTGRRLQSFDLPEDSLYYRGPPSGDCGSSSGGRYAVTFRNDGQEFQALVWDVPARKRFRTLRAPGPHEQVTSAFSPDSSLLAAWLPGKQTFIRIWDVRTGELIRSFPESKAGWAGQMSFTADGKTLFVAGKNVTAYEVSTGKELFSWRLKPLPRNSAPGTTAVGGPASGEDDRIGWRMLAVSTDGTRVAAILWGNGHFNERQENRLALYDARSGKLLRRWNDSGMPPNSYEQLAFSRDGQLLASSDGAVVHLWEVATSKAIATFKGHLGDVDSLSFSGDDRRLASASHDSTVLIWDTTGQTAGQFDDEAVERGWKDLLGDDAGRAHRAIWALARTPDKALPFLKVRLRPAKSVSRERIERLIQDLDSSQFDIREKAVAELEKLGELAEAALRRTLEGKPTLEQRRRIEPLVNKLETAIPAGEALRALRAVRVLEYAGTPEAHRHLRELAGGAEDARLTQQAKAALSRFARSPR
jgi:WD40 repeat protein